MATIEEMRNRRNSWPSARNNYHKRKTPLPKEFIAWDGEGVTLEDNSHLYILLMNSNGESIISYGGLSTEQCLNFMCDTALKNPSKIHVCYGASYDVNKILKDIPRRQLEILQKTNRVYWKNYRLEFIARKHFTISRYPIQKNRTYGDKLKRKPEVTITLWDVIGFFQSSFVKAIKAFFPDKNDQNDLKLATIIAGKDKRGKFTNDMIDNTIIPYTTLELAALVKLMDKFQLYCRQAGIILQRWDGAGAAAAAVLSREKVNKYFGVTHEKPKTKQLFRFTECEYTKGWIPWQVEEASQYAYSGGHSEIYKCGHTDNDTYNYDINSAYPTEMVCLPNLSNGIWTHLDKDNLDVSETGRWSLFLVYWDLDESDEIPILPFFYRTKNKLIRYPSKGYNWIWGPEVLAALQHIDKYNGTIEIFEQWKFVPGDDVKPYAFVRDLYNQRLQWKIEGVGAQIVLKLTINAFYGKTAQTVGYDIGKEGSKKRPPYYQLQYAGLITSGTRAKMYLAMMQKPDKIIAIATDGIWSTEPLNLPIGDKLGEWEFKKLKSFTSIQAGVYFGTLENGDKVHKYRGFNEDTISEKTVIDSWKNGHTIIVVPTYRFRTLGTSLVSDDRFAEWGKWIEDTRDLSIVPGGSSKRYIALEPGVLNLLSTSLVPTYINYHMQMRDVYSSRDLKSKHMSRKHPLPWEEKESFPGQEAINLDSMIKWEVMESEF